MNQKNLFTSILILSFSLNHLCFGQIRSMGFTQPIVTPFSGCDYKPKMKLLGNDLYVCSNTGIYKKNLQDNTDWELYAFENIPIIEFEKNEKNLLAISTGTGNGTDSLFLLSNDNGQTFFTSPHFLEYDFYSLSRISQNPEASNSILVWDDYSGISKSDDFGKSWKNLNNINFGGQHWHLGFHPLDTTTLYYTGETFSLAGMLGKSSDNGETWAYYSLHGGDNCIHSIAFHPTNPNILVYSGEGVIGKSTDKGDTWNVVNLYSTGMYFYKVLFDEENPEILYSSGLCDNYSVQDYIQVYRSTDMGNSWHLAYNENVNEDCGGVLDMIKYKNKLIFYTRNCGLFELDLEAKGVVSKANEIRVIPDAPYVHIYPNPTDDAVILQFTEQGVYIVTITDVTGKILLRQKFVDKLLQIDINSYPVGVYLLIIEDGNRKSTTRIMKK